MTKKLFVLDTNVLLSDPLAPTRFAEHIVHIPFIVLDELDNHKKGHTDLARNAREATRQLENIMQNEIGNNEYYINNRGGVLQFTSQSLKDEIPSSSNDNIIISETKKLCDIHRDVLEVSLVSRDINMRVKARSLNIQTEDYKADQYNLSDRDVIGQSLFDENDLQLDEATVSLLIQNYNSPKPLLIKIPSTKPMREQMFVGLTSCSVVYRITDVYEDYAEVQPLINYQTQLTVWGIRAKNREQNIALNSLLDTNKQLVAISGSAGSGKTLTAVASALTQVFDTKAYESIMFVKEVGMAAGSEEIGFLPGTKLEKIEGQMGPLFDNLKALTKETGSREKGAKPSPIPEQILERIEVETPGFLRGRSIKNTLIILDEVQNLTPSQMRLILTRAGEGSKIVLLGNVNQIDSAFLSASSNGFTSTIKAFHDWEKFAYIELVETVRSELADEAVKRLNG
jgi:PhoH-like ATPase